MGKPLNITEPEKELRFTRSRQGLTFVTASILCFCLAGFIWFRVYFNYLESSQINELIIPIVVSTFFIVLAILFFFVAVHCTRHAILILTPLGLELFPFWFPVKNFRMIYWSEMDNAFVSEDMKFMHIDCESGSKILISMSPIATDLRSYLKVAVEGRMKEKNQELGDKDETFK